MPPRLVAARTSAIENSIWLPGKRRFRVTSSEAGPGGAGAAPGANCTACFSPVFGGSVTPHAQSGCFEKSMCDRLISAAVHTGFTAAGVSWTTWDGPARRASVRPLGEGPEGETRNGQYRDTHALLHKVSMRRPTRRVVHVLGGGFRADILHASRVARNCCGVLG